MTIEPEPDPNFWQLGTDTTGETRTGLMPPTGEFPTRYVVYRAVSLFSRDAHFDRQELVIVAPGVQVTVRIADGAEGNRIQEARSVDYLSAISRLRREMGDGEYFAQVEPIKD